MRDGKASGFRAFVFNLNVLGGQHRSMFRSYGDLERGI